MKTKLISALRLAANALDSGSVPYDWYEHESCNCGILFCALTNKSQSDLAKLVPEAPDEILGDWKGLAGYHCPIAGKTTQSLFAMVMQSGLTVEDIGHLEYLSDPKVLARLPNEVKTSPRSWWQLRAKTVSAPRLVCNETAKDVALYMRIWADILTEEGAQDCAPAQESSAKQSILTAVKSP